MNRIGKARLKALGLRYAAYLRSEGWKRRKAAWFVRTGLPRACYACGSTRRLQFHHLAYDRLGRERDGDMMPLCAGCHRRLHLLQKHRRKRYVTWESVRLALKNSK